MNSSSNKSLPSFPLEFSVQRLPPPPTFIRTSQFCVDSRTCNKSDDSLSNNLFGSVERKEINILLT
nr:585_t:CDS:2 [Entrophospora candida]